MHIVFPKFCWPALKEVPLRGETEQHTLEETVTEENTGLVRNTLQHEDKEKSINKKKCYSERKPAVFRLRNLEKKKISRKEGKTAA